ncbi:FG-GAP-like repeat-containing protein [Streptomyces olivoreticuli]|uniref:FG-GAP-like repeat-containing protein n=1 Tax=Streptomyces olivoreticuli TaxID=68246 RepID=UPI002659570E|nr:FG-GAP-like repeat-containing protein [Streptomyces olivoreticuli]WKK25752.1 FG-GAP-like repeat-containing protein [Streptomyces olivoreticuli]
MPAKSSRTVWTTALLATTVGIGLFTAAPASALVGSDGSYAFSAKLNIGDEAHSRACTGTLVAPQWVLTAASCFADNPKQPTAVPAGPPALKTTATIGRSDLSTSTGSVRDVIELMPRTDRDVVLAKLAQPVWDITPAKLATTAPGANETLKAVGFGRTKTEWVPNKLHVGAFTVTTTDASTVGLNGSADAVLCQGDTGGPALREKDGNVEIAAVNSRSWQGGCLGTAPTEVRTGALSARTDDIADWIQKAVSKRTGAANEAGGSDRVRWADFDGDGRADYITIADNGAINVHLNRGGDGHGGWQNLGQVATGATSDRTKVRFADWDGDGRADYITIADNGAINVHLNRGGDGHGGWQNLGQVATGATSDRTKVRFADWDGDGRADYITIADNGTVNVYLNRGGDGAGSNGWQNLGKVATGATSDRSRVRFADWDGDGKADYYLINANGSITLFLNRGGDGAGSNGWQNLGKVATGLTTDQNKVQFVDFDGDTHADYVVGDTNNGAVVFAWNGGDGAGGWTGLGKVATGS